MSLEDKYVLTNLALNQLQLASAEMQEFRARVPFTSWEVAHALGAFTLWASWMRGPDAERASADVSMSARRAALMYVNNHLNPGEVARLRNSGVDVDPATEVVWGANNADHDAWHVSFTRALILLCRGIAHRAARNEDPVVLHLLYNVPIATLWEILEILKGAADEAPALA